MSTLSRVRALARRAYVMNAGLVPYRKAWDLRERLQSWPESNS